MAPRLGFPQHTPFRRRKARNSASFTRLREPRPVWTGEPLDLFDRLERHWYPGPARDDSDRQKRATEEDIAKFEAEHGVKVPEDFREYLLRFNGIEEDPEVFRFWPLHELRPVDLKSFRVPDRERYFFFADYLIECFYYAIYLGDRPELQNWVVIPCMPRQPFVAVNFTGFIELYLDDARAIYGPA
ncbi:SMI1/KNR4 family protein [Occallatibacter riparius]|uniref:SMI1/KNR4 family protein n=1 Tax=Occallatibacter riparius TaxID=1002689 RepID=A0A9J7BLC5_9BACT|nr:SMI1/KNR4 family protein [Occallatibacter riparius]UWZ83447.1 SMI1/KNR4 family protein [Occallatibacter riparius]